MARGPSGVATAATATNTLSKRFLIGGAVIGFIGLGAGIAGRFLPHPAKPESPAPAIDLLPTRDLASPSELSEEFETQRVDKVPDPKLVFEIEIPKAWEAHRPTELPGPASAERLTALMRFLSEDENAVIEVQYLRVPESVSVDFFMDTVVGSANYRVLQRQRTTFNEREVSDALLAKEGDVLGIVYTRLTVSRHGEYMIAVSSSAPKVFYEQYKRVFGIAALSFSMPES